MTLNDFMIIQGIKNENELKLFFKDNINTGKLPVALATCPNCQEIIEEYHKPHNCLKND